jgi:hypothetical protein
MLMKTPETDLHKTYITPTPTLQSLAYILRHKETWPPGFMWDYRMCTTCAMGLAFTTWNLPHWDMDRAFGIDPDAARAIFSGLAGGWFKTRAAVTPGMVADAIDKHLAV